MQSILNKTTTTCREKMRVYDERVEKEGCGRGKEAEEERVKKRHLALMKASEVVAPRFVRDLVEPVGVERFRARAVEGRK